MSWLKKITVEPPLLLFFTSFLLIGSLLTNLMIYRTCYVTLGYNETDCALLGKDTSPATQELEKKVQPTSNIISLISEIPLNVVPVVICVFAGPWSDKFGRKPIQLLTLIGLAITCGVMGILLCFKSLSPWYFLIATIPTALTGSIPTYFTVVLAYLNDIATDGTRAIRMVIFEAITLLGLLIGYLLSAPLMYSTDYATVFFIAAGILALASLYTMIVLPESIQTKESKKSNLKNTIDCNHVSDMVKVVFKKRDQWDRVMLILLVVAYIIVNFSIQGTNTIKFQYLRRTLSWTLEKYNYFNCAVHLIAIFGTITGTYILNRVLKIKENIIVLCGLVSVIGSCLLWGLADNDYYIFIACCVGVLSEIMIPMLRTRISQLVPPEDMGKVFSILIGLGVPFNIAASYLFTSIYNATIEYNSGIYNFVAATFYSIVFCIISVVVVIETCTANTNSYEIKFIDEVFKDIPDKL